MTAHGGMRKTDDHNREIVPDYLEYPTAGATPLAGAGAAR